MLWHNTLAVNATYPLTGWRASKPEFLRINIYQLRLPSLLVPACTLACEPGSHFCLHNKHARVNRTACKEVKTSPIAKLRALCCSQAHL